MNKSSAVTTVAAISALCASAYAAEQTPSPRLLITYTLQTCKDVQEIGKSLPLDGTYLLGNDIDCSESNPSSSNYDPSYGSDGFDPIDYGFTGSFDGQGYVISGLYIYRPTNQSSALFVHGGPTAEIRNLGLTNVDITGTAWVGGLASQHSGLISNVFVTGKVNGNSFVGGIVGQLGGVGDDVSNAKIINSYSKVKVALADKNDATPGSMGGLVGNNDGGEISDSYATGDIIDEVSMAGGLVGSHRYPGIIRNSYATGNIITGDYDASWRNSQVGGLVGGTGSGRIGDIYNSYATGDVYGYELVGGLVGYAASDGNFSNVYATGNVTGVESIGGLVGRGNGHITNAYATGDVSGENYVGGLVGFGWGSLPEYFNSHNSFATGTVVGKTNAGALFGRLNNGANSSNNHAYEGQKISVDGGNTYQTVSADTITGSGSVTPLIASYADLTNQTGWYTNVLGWSTNNWEFGVQGHNNNIFYPHVKQDDGSKVLPVSYMVEQP